MQAIKSDLTSFRPDSCMEVSEPKVHTSWRQHQNEHHELHGERSLHGYTGFPAIRQSCSKQTTQGAFCYMKDKVHTEPSSSESSKHWTFTFWFATFFGYNSLRDIPLSPPTGPPRSPPSAPDKWLFPQGLSQGIWRLNSARVLRGCKDKASRHWSLKLRGIETQLSHLLVMSSWASNWISVSLSNRTIIWILTF